MLSETFVRDFLRFSGTERRTTFWIKTGLYTLTLVVGYFLLAGVMIVGGLTQSAIDVDTVMSSLFGYVLFAVLFTLVYSLPLSVRRLRDTGYSLWCLAAYLILHAAFVAVLPPLVPLINVGFLLLLGFWPSAQTTSDTAPPKTSIEDEARDLLS